MAPMRVPAIESLPAPTRAETRNEVPLERTQASRAEMRAAIARAEEQLTGRPASPGLIEIATAQASLETASGRRMYNFNFGGIKGTSPSGLTTTANTHEWENGVRYRTQAHFRAYHSLDEGAADFLSLLHRRYGSALAAAEQGDVDGYAHALKQRGYFTGPEGHYANDLRQLLGLPERPELETPGASAGGASTPEAGSTFTNTRELALLLDAVSTSSARGAARIAAPDQEEA
jgi:hypothetical protein